MKKEDLKLITPTYQDTVEIFIEGDINDGDYVNNTNVLELEDFEHVLPILKKILASEGNEWGHNWQDSFYLEYLTEEEADLLFELYLIPSGENDEVHTITEIKCWFLSKEDSIRYEIIL